MSEQLADFLNNAAVTTLYQTWVGNFITNLRHYPNHGRVKRLFYQFANVPFIVAAAGPSLDAELGTLKSLDGTMPIMCVDRAYARLCAAGIEPDFVISMDPTAPVLEFFKDDKGAPLPIKDRCFLLELRTHPTVIEFIAAQGGQIFFWNPWFPPVGPGMNGDHFWSFANRIIGSDNRYGQIQSAPIVGASAVYMAYLLGASPIGMIGMDLSYRNYWEVPVTKVIRWAKNIEGETVPTIDEFIYAAELLAATCSTFIDAEDQVLYGFKPQGRDMREQFRRNEVRWINCSGGLLPKHIFKPMPLKEYIAQNIGLMDAEDLSLETRKGAYRTAYIESLEPPQIRDLFGLEYQQACAIEAAKEAAETKARKAAIESKIILPGVDPVIEKVALEVLNGGKR